MLILKQLKLQNIGRFVEEQTIDFTSLGSLVQVDGQNLNTNGSSGAGKSTVFKALDFLLGLNDISNGILQSRLTKESISVIGIFDYDGLPLRIERSKKLLIDLNGEITTGSSKLTEEKLDQIIGMPRDLFRKILHKRQGEGGFFLDMGSSEVHKFLTSCLNLEKEQSKILTLDARLKTLSDTETSFKTIVESNRMAMEATQNAILSLGSPPVLETTPEALEALKVKYTETLNNHKLVKNAHKIELEDFEKTRPNLLTVPFDRSNIEKLEADINDIKSKIANYEKIEQNRQLSIKDKISELQTLSNKLQNQELSRQSQVKSSISALKLAISKNEALVSLGSKAKKEATILFEELQKVKASICPTCSQNWITDECKAKESEILNKIWDHKKTVNVGNEAFNKITLDNEQLQILNLELHPRDTLEIEKISNEISFIKKEVELQTHPEQVSLCQLWSSKSEELKLERAKESEYQFKENAKTQLILVNWAQKQTELRKSHETTIKLVQDEENKATFEYESARNKIKSFEESQKRYQDSLNKLNEQLNKYAEQSNNTACEWLAVSEEIDLVQESKKCIKSYLSCSFEDALDSIGETATKLVRGIPNMATATVQFEGLKETKEGKIKEEVTCTISMDGEIGIPVKSLSGGERSSVDLGIDLAVIQFIEERTGKGIDLFILDEPFTGLDSQCCEDAIEMLKGCTAGKRIFLVDHNPVINQTIENRITVVRHGLTSKVVQL